MDQDPTTPAAAAVAARPRDRLVHWIIAGLLAIIAAGLWTRSTDYQVLPEALAQAPMAGARGIFAFTGPLDKNRTGLWMMDVDAGNVWVYEYLPATRKLRLAAARSFLFDRYLQDYNCDEPSIEQVRIMLDRERRAKNRTAGVGADPDDDGNPILGIQVPGGDDSDSDIDKNEGDR